MSSHYSRIARRLALCLLYGVFVLGPQLGMYDPWRTNNVPTRNILFSILDNLGDIAIHGYLPSGSLIFETDEDKLCLALFVSLLAAVHCAVEESDKLALLRPRSLACVVDLIGFIMSTSNARIPSLPLYLDVNTIPQHILLLWGNTVPWCWSLIEDERRIDVEYIYVVTSTWLCYTDKSEQADRIPSKFSMPSTVFQNPSCTLKALYGVMKKVSASLEKSQEKILRKRKVLIILSRSCWMTTKALRHCSKIIPSELMNAVWCCLTKIFFSLEVWYDVFAVQDIILETLCELSSNILYSNNGPPFQEDIATNMVEQAIINATSCLRTHCCNVRAMLNAKTLLAFLAMSWYAGVDLKLSKDIISSFTKAIMDLFTEEGTQSVAFEILVDTFLLALAMGKKIQNFDDSILLKMAGSSMRSNLLRAACLSSFMITRLHAPRTIFWTEALAYLADVFLLILNEENREIDDALAISICPTLCRALIGGVESEIVSYSNCLTQSPWMESMYYRLTTLIDVENSADHPFRLALYSRVKRYVQRLIHLLRDCLNASNQLLMEHASCGRAIRTDDRSCRNLYYYRRYPNSQLLMLFDP
ncbi:hypothetical protein BDQ17DRAFT_1535983 [Cyathus striatus]|nr:hypothetical protein BDQ17DRAFT_1535983 [Cyathus striatus]